MNAVASIAKPSAAAPRRAGKLKLQLAPAADNSPVDAPEPPSIVMPSAPEPIALRYLRRAPENVRHIRPDEDVDGLADNIAAHGLLQSLIGYRGGDQVMIVGGGRRLQALDILCNRFTISIDFAVPVLIRDREDAIELSLAENLDQRTMSPVDEFLAFKALMDRGDTSPAELAKRFGWKERTVKQRLRLAELAPEILDALAERTITLDAAMTYASSQDRHLQAEVFKAEARKTWEPHRTGNIRHALQMKGIKTDSPLYAFVGAEAYEARGGGYEDDLFAERDGDRTLANPFTLQTLAREKVVLGVFNLLHEWRTRKDLAPSIDGYVIDEDVLFGQYRSGEKTIAPKGWVKVERQYGAESLWQAIRKAGVFVKVLAGVNRKGEIDVWPGVVFVAKADKARIEPKQTGYVSPPPETPEQRAAREREAGILLHARRLAVGPFAGTPFEGRAYWPPYNWGRAETINGVEGQLVTVQIFVTDEEVKAQRAAAAAAYDAELAARASQEAQA